jgi:hypothetical protein
VTRRKLVTRPLLAASMSIMRPGVHTIISVPRFSSAICSEMFVPETQLEASVASNIKCGLLFKEV